jgi:hypothetical protein
VVEPAGLTARADNVKGDSLAPVHMSSDFLETPEISTAFDPLFRSTADIIATGASGCSKTP